MRGLLAVAVVGVLAACGSDSAPSSAPASNGLLTVLSAPWLPPWSGPNTPARVAERPLAPFCGVEDGMVVNEAVRRCFVDAATAGRPVEFATVTTTIEGDPFATVTGFDPAEGYYLLVDSTQDAFGSGAWSLQLCRRIVPSPGEVFTLEDCREGAEFR